MRTLLALLVAAISIAASAQTPVEIEIVAGEVVPEHLRPLALSDQEAMVEAWVAHEMGQILRQMVERGAEREVAAASLEASSGYFRELIETDWYGRLESFPNRDPRFSDLTDADILDLAEEAETAGLVCEQADHVLEFHNRNARARSERLAEALELRQTCLDSR